MNLKILSLKALRLQFGIRWLFLIALIVAIGVVVIRSQYTYTIFYSEVNASMHLPNGQDVETNRWIATSVPFELEFFPTNFEGEHYLCQYFRGNPHHIVVGHLEIGGQKYAPIVTDYTLRRRGNHIKRFEYWVKPRKFSDVTMRDH